MADRLNKKKIQRERVKSYFLEASIRIIKEEGLENLTTKKIGDLAGYSYATIYNYFENFNELICLSMVKIANECSEYISNNLIGDSVEDICYNFSDLMVDFNATNPNVYYPFLSTKVDFSYFTSESGDHFIHPAYNIILEKLSNRDEFQFKTPEELTTMLDIFTAIFNSALQFYIVLNNPQSINELKAVLKKQIGFILKKVL